MKRLEVKTLTLSDPDGWDSWLQSRTELNGPVAAYNTIPLIYRCVRLRADSLSSVEMNFYDRDGKRMDEVPLPFRDVDWAHFLWLTSVSLDLCGASFALRVANQYGIERGLQWINPFGITVEVNQQTGMVEFRRTSSVVGDTRTLSADEVLYIREFNPSDDIRPGTGAVQVAINDARLLNNVKSFSSQYFKNGAMPITILGVGNAPQAEAEKLATLFRQIISGVRNAFRVVALSGDIKPTTITPDPVDLAMTELTDESRRSIAAAFGIPQTMLEDAANYATAVEHTRQFWTNTIRPLGLRITGAINKQILAGTGITARLEFDELDIFQEDEAQRADSLAKLVAAGMPLVMACDVLGYDIADQQREELVKLASNAAQVALPQPAQEPTQKDFRSALFMWRRDALAAFRGKKSAEIEFDHPAVPENVAKFIRYELGGCSTEDDINLVFTKAKQLARGEDAEALDIAGDLRRARVLLERMSHA